MRATRLALSLVLALWAGRTPATAQAERHGLRVHYTSIAAAGGLEGRAFLPVSSQGVALSVVAAGTCAGARHLTIKATLTRGPLRAIRLRVPATKAGRVELGGPGCASADIETGLDDGSVLKAGRGYVELQSEPSKGDATFRGVFAQTTERNGVPVTIEGTFVVPAGQATRAP